MNLNTSAKIDVAANRVSAVNRTGLTREVFRGAFHMPFEAIANIVASCDEKTDALMRPRAT